MTTGHEEENMMIELRKMTASDYDRYATLVHDERVMRYITEQPLTDTETKQRFERTLEQQKHDRLGSYLIYADETWTGIGHMTRSQTQPFKAELGYMLLPDQ
jgi:RimJ/RimL family protein N-acetyltransferase